MNKLYLFFFLACVSMSAFANSGADVIQSFNGPVQGGVNASFEEVRFQHEILFYMGFALLIAIFITAGLGISMVLLGKQVFVAHMISGGIVVFLSIAHAVAAVVWFFPFK